MSLIEDIREKLHGEDPFLHEIKRNVPAISFATGGGIASHLLSKSKLSNKPMALVLAPVLGGTAFNIAGNAVAGVPADQDSIATTSAMALSYGSVNAFDHLRHAKGLAPNNILRDTTKGGAALAGGLIAVALVRAALKNRESYERYSKISSYKDSFPSGSNVPIQG